IVAILAEAIIDEDVLALDVAELAQPLAKSPRLGRISRRSSTPDPADPPDLCRLLAARRERPHRHGAAKKPGESPPLHSMTSSARSRIAAGIFRPSVLAVFRLTTSWNRVGCCMGKSAGLAPFRILSTYPAASRNCSETSRP